MKELTGKIVASMRYCDPWEAGLSITFTDGTVLHVYETPQTGAIAVEVNDERIISDWYLNDDEE
jgi:hypothetical protein